MPLLPTGRALIISTALLNELQQVCHSELAIISTAELALSRFPARRHIEEGESVTHQEADEHFCDDASPDRSERLALTDQFGFFEDVVPQRRRATERLLQLRFRLRLDLGRRWIRVAIRQFVTRADLELEFRVIKG